MTQKRSCELHPGWRSNPLNLTCVAWTFRRQSLNRGWSKREKIERVDKLQLDAGTRNIEDLTEYNFSGVLIYVLHIHGA